MKIHIEIEPVRATPGEGNWVCWFCGKTQREVKALVAGPGRIAICDECVGLCVELVAALEEKEKAPR